MHFPTSVKKMGEIVEYADDATIMTEQTKKQYKNNWNIHLKKSSLRIITTKNNVYVAKEQLKPKVQDLMERLGLQNTSNQSHKFKQTASSNTDKLKGGTKSNNTVSE